MMSIVSDVTHSLLEKESAFAYFYNSLQEFELPGLAEPLEAELFWLKGKINVYEMLQDKLYERFVRKYHQCFTTQCYTELGLYKDQRPVNIDHPDWALVDHYHVGVAYATYVMLRIIQYYDYKELSTQFIKDYFTQNESWFNVHRQKIYIINRQISEMPEISEALSKDYDYTQKPTDDVYSFVEDKLSKLKLFTNNSPTWRDKEIDELRTIIEALKAERILQKAHQETNNEIEYSNSIDITTTEAYLAGDVEDKLILFRDHDLFGKFFDDVTTVAAHHVRYQKGPDKQSSEEVAVLIYEQVIAYVNYCCKSKLPETKIDGVTNEIWQCYYEGSKPESIRKSGIHPESDGKSLEVGRVIEGLFIILAYDRLNTNNPLILQKLETMRSFVYHRHEYNFSCWHCGYQFWKEITKRLPHTEDESIADLRERVSKLQALLREKEETIKSQQITINELENKVTPHTGNELHHIKDHIITEKELQTVIRYFKQALLQTGNVKCEEQAFDKVWDDIIKVSDVEDLLKRHTSLSCNYNDFDAPGIMLKPVYNLKLILNILGLMALHELISMTAKDINGLFFDDTSKQVYIQKGSLEKYGESECAFTDKGMSSMISTSIISAIAK